MYADQGLEAFAFGGGTDAWSVMSCEQWTNTYNLT